MVASNASDVEQRVHGDRVVAGLRLDARKRVQNHLANLRFDRLLVKQVEKRQKFLRRQQLTAPMS